MILLVDSNDIFRVTLTRQLAELGYISHSVSNLSAAVECALSGSYKLMLVDVSSSSFNGNQIAKAVRQRCKSEQKAYIPIVAVRHLDEEHDHLEDMDDFLEKPVSLEQLRLLTDRLAPQKESGIIEQITPALTSLIRSRRIELGYSIENLASKSDISAEHLQQIEDGARLLMITDLIKLALALKVATSDLVQSAQNQIDAKQS